ncbi:MAG: 30S ribosomal protein S4 [Acidobacteria bacterium]|nr:30S ribosomal protein S4 [Acidobacteriota bacterium]
MARYRGAVCRLCRREGTKLFLKGERCFSDKCALEKRPYPPGEHGRARRLRIIGYGLQLREKQKVRRIYGVLERQFRIYFKKAERKRGITGENLLSLLERRLDNVVFRLGFASSRPQARQMVRHGHIEVNGKKVDIPSYLVKKGDTIAVREKSKKLEAITQAMQLTQNRPVPKWLEVDYDNLVGKVVEYPSREDIDFPVQEQLIVELYSK